MRVFLYNNFKAKAMALTIEQEVEQVKQALINGENKTYLGQVPVFLSFYKKRIKEGADLELTAKQIVDSLYQPTTPIKKKVKPAKRLPKGKVVGGIKYLIG